MPSNRARNRKVERQLVKISEQLREMQLENRQGRKEARDLRDLQAQGVQAEVRDLRDLQADGVQALNHILTLGKQAFSEVRGDLYDMNQTLTEVKTELETLNSKLDRVLDQTSKVQVEEDEIKMRLAKLETNESLNKKHLQNVLPFSGIERGLQNVAP